MSLDGFMICLWGGGAASAASRFLDGSRFRLPVHGDKCPFLEALDRRPRGPG